MSSRKSPSGWIGDIQLGCSSGPRKTRVGSFKCVGKDPRVYTTSDESGGNSEPQCIMCVDQSGGIKHHRLGPQISDPRACPSNHHHLEREQSRRPDMRTVRQGPSATETRGFDPPWLCPAGICHGPWTQVFSSPELAICSIAVTEEGKRRSNSITSRMLRGCHLSSQYHHSLPEARI